MKHLLLATIALFALSCAAQKMVRYEIDTCVSLQLPANADEQFDSSQGSLISAYTKEHAITITLYKLPEDAFKDVSLAGKTELDMLYAFIAQGFMAEYDGGTLISIDYYTKDSLEWVRFSFSMTGEAHEHQIRYCESVLIHETVYIFQFWERAAKAPNRPQHQAKFFSTIQTADGLTLQSQLLVAH